MNTAFFISRRISGKSGTDAYSRPVVNIAVAGIALGLCVMVIAIAIVTGFQQEIRNKIIGFSAHIRITSLNNNKSFETDPIQGNLEFLKYFRNDERIKNIQSFATKPGILKTNDEIHGVIFKGIGPDFNPDFFQMYLVEGHIFKVSSDTTQTLNEIVISKEICRKLKANLGDTITSFFINRPGEKAPIINSPQRPPRKFVIAGIYETGLSELDDQFILADIRQIQELNNWYYDKVSGFEIYLNNYSDLKDVAYDLKMSSGYDIRVQTVKQVYPEIFDWLAYMDINVIIIIVLMIVVALMAMTSTLLILILEKTNLIGILKALGMRNIQIREIFIYRAADIIVRGMIIGNVFGLGLIAIQKHFEILTLDEKSYYLKVVPVNFDVVNILLINLVTFGICVFVLIFPSYLITKISPLKAIRFD